ncbi:methionine-rich copper-binding protein CopC [Pseudomonas citronellolis]|uniref:copper homeostasis periplasmic binding protein CopC n=1 Tax=Pseudomonas citronellolis TaxID=53408 RepID=UPI00209E8BBA|nr:copper homeostasis periplasmic binding protein CopC [Pseudomonas citronellolis]MCP1644979.1 methionine-rich copper-binding protein CopC [Pseudomonas citronellolis]MCP1668021.1 methionine-rich copper-binding protein CopC [Pseudomonas citronellolis]MCP1699133.1 methionine-rich copper-binding protein CopC [Pseudomonas citronellolis]MCP1705664.1 methionine-rich copper-binding protein CopC [Pseudomonas citronellolis]MCP1799697.1 methionine-rich copper-binding protein CopC [Pseudomonas citronello
MLALRTPFLAAATAACALLFSAAAQARPKLLSSDPQASAEVAAPARIELHFSETLTTRLSGAKLVMSGMPGMSHGPMPVQVKVSAGEDGKTMVITSARALMPGDYRVEWRAVSSDTRPVTGNFSFKVK